MEIRKDSPDRKPVRKLLQDYIAASRATHPAHAPYVLDIEALIEPGVTFWSASQGELVAGCIAMKELGNRQAEIKSLCVDPSFRGRGIGRMLVDTLIADARRLGLSELLLETGNMEFYEAARQLYASFDFEPCGPFADYADDPVSRFMRLDLSQNKMNNKATS
ncbi:MAG: GNAT family N-acetyltransferase [Gammaproteobacteria bacterium]|nr:GNAT family N-acetyltransferase [Gammaproteobacteria bacterium]